jgi:poly(3-hydroxybutyrate) depolymerase
MQYYLSLPDGWSADRTWPILVVVEAAEKQFRQNAARFVQARGKAPFIVVAPLIVTNGNQGLKNPEIYPYTPETWQRIDQEGGCRFDLEGLARVIQDVQKAWHGEDRFYLTGFEAGAHLVWALTFQHPERPNAAAPVAGNYRGRCMTDSSFSSDPARVRLPIRGFIGAADTAWGPDGRGYAQWEEAKGLAAKHGYTNLSETRVPGKGHVPMPGEVIAWFDALRQSAGSREAR